MTREEAKDVFLNRGFVKVDGGEIFDGDKWRQSVVVISEWLKQEPCEDAISREVVQKWYCQNCCGRGKHNCSYYPCNEIKDILNLPSATSTRRAGKWMRQTDDYHDYYECEYCGIAIGLDDTNNYCPNCGTKMEVTNCE